MIGPRGLMIAAPASGAGKTMLTAGLARALTRRGVSVAVAKSGPDYIDPGFHAAACGRPCVNLDAWCMDPDTLLGRAWECGAELLLVEAAMGLMDGAPDAASPMGRGSAGDLAAALGLPVLLVLDVARQAQSAAAIPLGLAALRPDLTFPGVVLNRVGSARHEAMVQRSLEATGTPVLGAIPRAETLAHPSRHLGLTPAGERPDLEPFLDAAADLAAGALDLQRLSALAAPLPPPAGPIRRLPPPGQRVAIARDHASAFVYAHLLEDWRRQGAEISLFSPLLDQPPDPSADALFLPGGYPELHAGALASARRFKAGVHAAARRGALIYGECGGYMTLGAGLVDAQGARHAMLGLLPLETSFEERRLTLGYRRLEALGGGPLGGRFLGGRFLGHEFHYATVLSEGSGAPLFQARDAEGAPLAAMGLRQGRVCGSFAHVVGVG